MKPRFLTSSILFLLAAAGSSMAQEAGPSTAEQVVERMLQRDIQRQASTQGYAGMRRYILQNDGMHKRAEMLVRVSGDSDGSKHFEILSEQGWKAAQKHVLRKMLESEAQTSRPDERAKTRLCSENYEFQMIGREQVGERPAYVIEVTPKRRDQYLFAGRIWVDGEDYALVRAEGHPAKNPSFWTKHVNFVQSYQKAGPFWFPLSTESITDARIFGRTDLTIEYFDYKPSNNETAGVLSITGEGSGLQ
jgi:MucB/RseB N-terminal domain